MSDVHELSIAMAVVDQVESAVREQGADAGDTRVGSLTLRVGRLSGVVPEALDFSFAVAAQGTVLADARLLIETVEGRARCEECGRDVATGMPPDLWCGVCSRPMSLTGGRELEIVRVVLEDPESRPGGDVPEASHVPHR
ncbi:MULTISPECIES: hydrogenase maturation nickel metallochaperone HypA [unclassified Streptomyces]|uniref:hydrogenase maturation nickel metallochaperone HypA/HybF n=1 Tax=unclassified Streptomyces TaxID=2593676 RepID=UPI003405A119